VGVFWPGVFHAGGRARIETEERAGHWGCGEIIETAERELSLRIAEEEGDEDDVVSLSGFLLLLRLLCAVDEEEFEGMVG